MKTLKTLTALLICYSAFGQDKVYNNIIEPNGDSTFWFKHVTERAKKLSLPLLGTSSKSEYIRIWTSTQAIDIWKTERKDFSGMLTTWTDEYVGDDEEPTNRTFRKTKQLSSDTADVLRNLITAYTILELPTEDSIVGWRQGFDGIIYLIEHSTTSNYSLKSYWTPKSQGGLREALLVQSFVDTAFLLANAQLAWVEFSKEIPFERYGNGGPGVAMRIVSEKQRKKYRKERQKYRQQQLRKYRAAKHKGN